MIKKLSVHLPANEADSLSKKQAFLDTLTDVSGITDTYVEPGQEEEILKRELMRRYKIKAETNRHQ